MGRRSNADAQIDVFNKLKTSKEWKDFSKSTKAWLVTTIESIQCNKPQDDAVVEGLIQKVGGAPSQGNRKP